MQPHWERVYSTKSANEVSWYSPHLERSLELIRRAVPDLSASIIDVGGGASTLVDDLLQLGYRELAVLDISETALNVARNRLGDAAGSLRWICGDVTKADLHGALCDLWHDRAVFHFLTDEEDRRNYVRTVARAVRPGGHVIVSTFGPQGPLKCSGLDVKRYSADQLHNEFGGQFRLIESSEELHRTPFGTTQQFVYCYCRYH